MSALDTCLAEADPDYWDRRIDALETENEILRRDFRLALAVIDNLRGQLGRADQADGTIGRADDGTPVEDVSSSGAS